jgi:hypothetical protein
MLIIAPLDLAGGPGVHVDRVWHEASDRAQVNIAVRLQDDPEVGTLAAVHVDRPEELALMTFWHFYNFPRLKIICRAHNPLFPEKELSVEKKSRGIQSL